MRSVCCELEANKGYIYCLGKPKLNWRDMTILLITSYPYLTRQVAKSITERLTDKNRLTILESEGPFCNNRIGTDKYKTILFQSTIMNYKSGNYRDYLFIETIKNTKIIQKFWKKLNNLKFLSGNLITLRKILFYISFRLKYTEYLIKNRKNAKTDKNLFRKLLIDLNPDFIILLTDHYQFIRILNSPKIREKTVLLAPSLVRKDYKSFISKITSSVFNTFIGLDCINMHDWGSKFRGKYLGVWNISEMLNTRTKIPVAQLGSYFFNQIEILSVEVDNSCLVVLHEFNTLVMEDFQKYQKFLDTIISKNISIQFTIRYHPRNEIYFELNYVNVTIDDSPDFDWKQLSKFKHVVSSFSALAVEIGFVHRRIALIDLSEYDRIKHFYNNSNFFIKIENFEMFQDFLILSEGTCNEKFLRRRASLETSSDLNQFLNNYLLI